jgi:general secretion pathway protein G
MNRRWRVRRQAGVTLIEMLVVMAIIALFATLVVPNMLKRTDTARVTAARSQINSFLTALAAYKLDTGLYPSSELGFGALREKPQGVNNWQGPYMKDIPNDPWGRPYQYRFPSEHGNDEPDILSLGADGAPGGADINADIASWKAN